jgi:hypothetical protein
MAYEPGLNTLSSEPDPIALEKWLAAHVDDPAARVINRLPQERTTAALSATELRVLFRFVLSLLERRPVRVEERERVGETVLDEMLQEPLGRRIVATHGEAFLREQVNPKDRSRALLLHLIDGEEATAHFARIDCTLVELDENNEECFATSDDPVIRFEASGVIHATGLAIDPRLLLVVHPKAWEFTDRDTLALAALHDLKLIMQPPSAIFSRRQLDNNTAHFGLQLHYRKLMEEYLLAPSWM